MIRIAALTSGKNIPSASFRVNQYIPRLKKDDIIIRDFNPIWNKFEAPPKQIRRYLRPLNLDTPKYWNILKRLDRYQGVISSYFHDITWIQKVLIPYHLTLELKTKKPMVFDLDDAIWLDEGKGFTHKIVGNATMVFAGNSYMADWCGNYNKNVKIVHTAVDTNFYHPFKKEPNSHFIIGWLGSSSNFKYFNIILEPLTILLNRHKDIRVKIIADRYPIELSQIKEHLDFVPWHPINHIAEMRDFTVGIMPLIDDEWTKGKCSFKMLQYMAMGIPVIVSPFGMNKEVLEQGDIGFGPINTAEWVDALEYAYLNNMKDKGLTAHNIIKHNYSTEIIAQKIAKYFKELT